MSQKSQSSITCDRGHFDLRAKCGSCKDIKNNWYSNIQDQGFIDVEKQSNPWTYYRLFESTHFQTKDSYENKLSYYLWAKEKADNAKFQKPRDITIWEKHAEGFSFSAIGREIGLSKSRTLREVHRIRDWLKSEAEAVCVSSLSFELGLL